MSRKKEPYMDYATQAFQLYSQYGCRTRDEIEADIRENVYNRLALMEPDFIVMKANAAVSLREPFLKEIDAVNHVFETLEKQGKTYIADAIRAIYFPPLPKKHNKGIWGARVLRYSLECPCHKSTVYRWLKSARLLYAKYRGLYTGPIDGRW